MGQHRATIVATRAEEVQTNKMEVAKEIPLTTILAPHRREGPGLTTTVTARMKVMVMIADREGEPEAVRQNRNGLRVEESPAKRL